MFKLAKDLFLAMQTVETITREFCLNNKCSKTRHHEEDNKQILSLKMQLFEWFVSLETEKQTERICYGNE